MAKNTRISVTEAEVEEMVMKVDSNGDGLIDFEEFKILCRNMAAGDLEAEEIKIDSGGVGGDELRDAFEVFDRDRDGMITVEELGSVLSSLGLKEGKRMEACKEMIRRVDADGDGMVNFDEFRTVSILNLVSNHQGVVVNNRVWEIEWGRSWGRRGGKERGNR
ncbi:unnamed protein product [Linum tenue]|uniref:EF-hand domain-containing protein n=1 Tax=Linum tenue TaxID=586396 RepID=A0AAV0LBA3_9ROSI|nr:unnamed protein product [Linum tenue]